jgi:hypothetical protein
MNMSSGILRYTIQVDKEGLQIWPIDLLYLIEEHRNGCIIPTIEYDNNMIQ